MYIYIYIYIIIIIIAAAAAAAAAFARAERGPCDAPQKICNKRCIPLKKLLVSGAGCRPSRRALDVLLLLLLLLLLPVSHLLTVNRRGSAATIYLLLTSTAIATFATTVTDCCHRHCSCDCYILQR